SNESTSITLRECSKQHKSKSGRLWKKRPWISLVILWLRIAQNLHQNQGKPQIPRLLSGSPALRPN
ncbi:MAG TPA: hypothetical protein VJX16_27860, partial [Terriglobales bacterium]|nr:hypothetical protein [Terriglobales bacterium]